MRTGAAYLLLIVGLLTILVAAHGAAAQSTGICYIGSNCSSEYTADYTCAECFALRFTHESWQADASSPCSNDISGCTPTAVTFLNVDTPITSCNAAWTVPGIGLLGMVLAAGGLGILKRSHRAG